MFENTQSLLSTAQKDQPLQVISVGFEDASLDELENLLKTLEAQVVGRFLIPLRRISPATYIGKGKVEEIKAEAEKLKVHAVIFDADLSPKQLRNLEKEIGKQTLDRSGVIIEIFSQHARTKEAKTQVELAKLEYLLPRLAHFWTHFERQRGGIGMKGMGEKQLEVDRRILKNRMKILRTRLGAIEKERSVQRAGRQDLLKVALVGYTNAGKSTLLNAMTQSHVRAEDKLFATLDSSVRALDPDSHPPVVAIDTVGFINKIPPSLIASFRSTLEELHQADLFLHVIDAASPHAKEQFEVVEKILGELGLAAKPRISVLNKIDQIKSKSTEINRVRLVAPGALRISSLNPSDVEKVREKVMQHFQSRLELWEILVPYTQSRLEAQLHSLGKVETIRYIEKGVFYRVRIDSGLARRLDLSKYHL